MIEDYKKQEFSSPQRHARKGTIRVVLGVAVLATVVGLVYRSEPVDLIPTASAEPAAPMTFSTPLELPGLEAAPGVPVQAANAPMPPPHGALDADADTAEPALNTALLPLKPLVETATETVGPVRQEPSPKPIAAAEEGGETSEQREEPAKVETSPVHDAGLIELGVSSEPEIAVETGPAWRWVEHEVKSGDSLARIFASMDLAPAVLHRIVSSGKKAKTLSSLRPGQTLRFKMDEDGELAQLVWQQNAVRSLRVSVDDEEISTEQLDKELQTRVASASGIITSSLFAAGQEAGLTDRKIMELAEIFGWDIDFALEIRAGDHFRVLYEEQFLNGEHYGDGAILAAEFTNRGTSYTAVRYESTDGDVDYYDNEGHNKRRAFIRTPIKFARVSSRYNPRRWHPVLKRWRAHKGVDYAAPTGTPIRATGDGRVSFRGTKRGYGKTVILEHAGKYTTLYAHMSKYSKRARSGKRVKQGQVIGYVGKTGLATGPHLHYEFRVNGVHKDPLKVKLPKTLSLPKKELERFQRTTAPLLADLRSIPTETLVARNDARE